PPWYLHPVGKANLRTNSWLLVVNSTQLALKLAARKALIIRSSGFLRLLSKFQIDILQLKQSIRTFKAYFTIAA
ncbi:hypothetical protein CWB95_21880, partial [Pseudoalteromonas piscicida]